MPKLMFVQPGFIYQKEPKLEEIHMPPTTLYRNDISYRKVIYNDLNEFSLVLWPPCGAALAYSYLSALSIICL